MSARFQPYVQQLADLSFTIGTTQTPQEVDLRLLEKKLYKEAEIANLCGFVLEADLDPTFTAVPAVIGANNSLARIAFYDGSDMLFDGQGNDLRMFESLEQGYSIQGEVINQTSTNNRYWSRFLPAGPLALAGSPSDYMIPCAELAQGGKLSITPSVLTDISADTTAATLVVHVYAILAPSGNELRVGPKYQRLVRANAGATTNISDEALYAYIGFVEAAYAAISAADLSKVTVSTTKRGRYVDAVDAEGLRHAFNIDAAPGMLGAIVGEPRDGSLDVAPRIVNVASPTAIAAQAHALQPIVWSPRGCRLSKLRVRNDQDDTLSITYSGAQAAAGSYLLGRFLPHTQHGVQNRVKKAANVLGMSSGQPSMKTLNKRAVKPSAQAAKYGVYYAKAA